MGENTDFVFPSNSEFTIEQWQYIVDFNYDRWFMAKGTGSSSCLKTYAGTLYLQTEGNFTSAVPANVITLNKWQHVALVQKNGILKLYVDGVVKMTLTANANFGLSNTLLCFGGGSPEKLTCNGYIDQMRVSRIARYEANFEPLTLPFKLD